MRSADERREALRRGIDAEAFVASDLEVEGWQVLAHRWSCAGGELDLVVMRDGSVRFVEVRARRPEDPTGLESITPAKQAKLVQAAEAWLQGRDVAPTEVCFLVAIVDLDPDGWTVEYVDDAFDA